jgi:hypothetical protein
MAAFAPQLQLDVVLQQEVCAMRWIADSRLGAPMALRAIKAKLPGLSGRDRKPRPSSARRLISRPNSATY